MGLARVRGLGEVWVPCWLVFRGNQRVFFFLGGEVPWILNDKPVSKRKVTRAILFRVPQVVNMIKAYPPKSRRGKLGLPLNCFCSWLPSLPPLSRVRRSKQAHPSWTPPELHELPCARQPFYCGRMVNPNRNSQFKFALWL